MKGKQLTIRKLFYNCPCPCEEETKELACKFSITFLGVEQLTQKSGDRNTYCAGVQEVRLFQSVEYSIGQSDLSKQIRASMQNITSHIFYGFKVVTVRKRSCGKVMLSQVSVILLGGGSPLWPLPMMHWDMGTPSLLGTRYGTYPLPSPFYWHLVVITGDLLKHFHLRTYHPLPPVLTSSIGHRRGRYASHWDLVIHRPVFNPIHKSVSVVI